jgi:hypothetical protein
LNRKNVTEQQRGPRTWKTREDPLAEIWPKAPLMLQDAPELEAPALFDACAQAASLAGKTLQAKDRSLTLDGVIETVKSQRRNEVGVGGAVFRQITEPHSGCPGNPRPPRHRPESRPVATPGKSRIELEPIRL